MPDPWRLTGFTDGLDEWISLEAPDEWLRILVGNWVLSRIENPYDGVRREPDFENLWFGVVPGSLVSNDSAVACSFWIYERAHAVRCDRIATLSWPIE